MADKKRKVNKVVLAYSGGLDTSVNVRLFVLPVTWDRGRN